MLNNDYIMQKVVITLHGYGASGADFAEVGKIFLAKKLDNVVIEHIDTGDYAEQ